MTTLWHSQVVNSTVTMRENPSPDGASIIIYIPQGYIIATKKQINTFLKDWIYGKETKN